MLRVRPFIRLLSDCQYLGAIIVLTFGKQFKPPSKGVVQCPYLKETPKLPLLAESTEQIIRDTQIVLQATEREKMIRINQLPKEI